MHGLRLTLFVIASGLAGAAQAQPIVVADSGDNGWMLAATLLTLIAALPGIALIYGGDRRGHAGLAIFSSVASVTLLFAIIGYSLAFSEGTGLLGGLDDIMLVGLPDVQPDMTISGAVYALFELAAALLAVAIVVGSIAHRTRIGWLLAFAALWTMIVYVPVVHWIWGGGWLAELGALDYSGGIVIQVTAGVSALVVALLLGRDRDAEEAEDARIVSGAAAVFWVGWLALIGGSGFAATGDAAEALLKAQLAASSAMLAGLAIERFRTGGVSARGAAMSAFAGLAAISAAADLIAPEGAILIGIVGAVGATAAAALVRALRLGSASAAFIAHGGGGILGAITFPIFVLPAFGGPGFDEGLSVGTQLATQGIAVLAVALWAAIATAIAALMISMVLPMADQGSAA